MTGKIDRNRRGFLVKHCDGGGAGGADFVHVKRTLVIIRITAFPMDDKFVFGDILFFNLILCELNIFKTPLWGPAKPKR